MEPDPEWDPETGEPVTMSRSFPWLRLYEEGEYEYRMYYAPSKAGDSRSDVWSTPTKYTQLRFFCSIIGFHEGSLDLSGRHRPRYQNLFDLWSDFVSDAGTLQAHATQYEYTEDILGQDEIFTDYRFDAEGDELWARMRTKWRLAKEFDFSSVVRWTREVSDKLVEQPKPKLQELCLVHLPVELLDTIFENATLARARLLSATCHYLRDIGLRYIFGSRLLQVEAEPDWHILRNDPSGDHTKYLLEVASHARDKFVNSTDFLLSRPDILRSIGRLHISNGWSAGALRHTWARNFDISEHDPAFYESIMLRVVSTMQATAQASSTTMTALLLHSFELTEDVLAAIPAFESLELVSFLMCSVPRQVQRRIQTHSLPPCPAVLNVRLTPDVHGDEQYTLWHVLPLFPYMRTLAISGHYDGVYHAPIEEVQAVCNPFAYLERLSLENFTHYQVADLMRWLLAPTVLGSAEPCLKLTHLLIHCRWPIVEQDIPELVSALQHAPSLEVLALDGLDEAPPGLIRSIALAAPDLLGLTLIRRENHRQHQTKLANWRAPSWEYAQHLSLFSRLRYFGWNAAYDVLHGTPSALLDFEDDFKHGGFTFHYDEEEPTWLFCDGHLTAAPFAAHCPTLEQFAVLERREHAACRITRTADGYPKFEDVPWRDRMDFCLRWYPLSGLRRHWPIVSRKNLAARSHTTDTSPSL